MRSSDREPGPRSSVLSPRAAVVLVFLLAMSLRLIVLFQLQGAPLFRTPQLDALEYFEWGSQLSRGNLSWPAAPIHGPGYPLFLGAILALGKSLIAVGIVQAIIGSLSAVLVMGIGVRMFGGVAGLVAGLLHAIYAPLIFVDVSIIAEGLFTFLLTLGMWLTLKTMRGEFARPLISVAALGCVLGLAIIVRPTAAAVLPLFALFSLRTISHRRATAWLLFAAAVALPVVPVLILNAITSPGLVAVQTSGGMNFYIGNSPQHDGTAWARPGGMWDELRGAAWRSGAQGAAAEDRYYFRTTVNEIAAAPAAFVRLLGTKLVWLLQNEEVRDSHSFHFFAEMAPLLRWLPRFGVVFALAIAGAAAVWRGNRPREYWLAAGYVLILGATVVGLVAGLRYRIPIMPALFLFAGAALSSAIASLRSRRSREVLLISLLFLGGLLVTHLREHPASHDFSEEMTMTALALKNEGDLDAAVVAARRATLLNPRRDAAFVALGDIEATRGRWTEAEAAWLQAVRIQPNNARAWSHLGLVRVMRGEKREAEIALRRALSIRFDEEAAYNIEVMRRGAR
jgi:tetratricopeptide (TPR) repeat protein